MIGTLVNTGTVAAGSLIGLIFKKALPQKYQTIYFQAIGLFTLLLGCKMSLNMTLPLLTALSLVLGGITGEAVNLEARVEQFGSWLKTKTGSQNDKFTTGLTTAFLRFCLGAMTITGAIEEGFGRTSDLLLTKSILDFFSSIMLASALGAGVLFSALPLLLFQGGITLLVSLLGRGIPPEIISELTVVSGIILIGLGINLLEIKKLKVINLLPALLWICFFVWLKNQLAYLARVIIPVCFNWQFSFPAAAVICRLFKKISRTVFCGAGRKLPL